MLAYVDISYLTLKFFLNLIKILNSIYPGRNMMNIYCGFHPFLLHPLLKITQMAMIILTVILSVDRFIVVFYPYQIYRQIQVSMTCSKCAVNSVNGCLRTLLRGPKKIQTVPYLATLLGTIKVKEDLKI